MLRPTQQVCRRTFSRPIGIPSLCEIDISTRLGRTIIPPSHLRNPRASQRHFVVSRSFAARSPKILQNQASAATTAAAETPLDTASPSHSPKPSRRRRHRGLYYATLFLILGTAAGTFVRITIAPPTLPIPGSDEDAYLQSKIQSTGAALPIVERLSRDPSWASWDAYAGVPRTPQATNPGGISAAQSRITSGPMAGSSGLAFQRVFHNAATGELVTVVYFGAGLAGWPGIVHGGALATVLDESLGRCAILRFPSRTGVTANLEMQYRAPTLTNNFYVIRTEPIARTESDGVPKSDRKLWVRGSLETENGKVCVEAKALFVVPRGYELRPLVQGF
ncbi:hypothetical protein GGS20DRAFT_266107 [Poronia punctata]|nr:hypothetical protein GGS20DRAFT_266107 [Poronia punctata]